MSQSPDSPKERISPLKTAASGENVASANPQPEAGKEEKIHPEEKNLVGNLADLKEGEVLLPSFITRKVQGLFADLELLEKQPFAFAEFVHRTFTTDFYFTRLDYRIFSTLLFDPEKAAKARKAFEAPDKGSFIRFAEDIAKFPEERKSLYRAIKLGSRFSDAQYFFEPLMIDKRYESLDDHGKPVVTRVSEKTTLVFDELVAYLWKNEVRYGLLENEIREFISQDLTKTSLVTVARQLDPTPGQDASIHEECDKLHRDRSPKVLADGRVDLRFFKNTFPQIAKDVRILRKIPLVMGSPGRNIAGVPIEAPKTKDIDLSKLAGAWIRYEKTEAGEFLISNMAGFLNIDTKTHQLFMTERLINREGINIRTTGSLDVHVNQFEEHGDIDKGFSITGQSIHVKGNVFGAVISKGGILKIGGNVLQGEVRNADGPIEVGGFASKAFFESKKGEVRLKRAENSVIIAKKLVLQEARNCMVVADEVEITMLQNCVVAGKAISVGRVALKSGISERSENVFVLEVPDLAELAQLMDEERAAIKEMERNQAPKKSELEKKLARSNELMEIPSVKSYLEYAKKVKTAFQEKGRKLTPEQARAFAFLRGKVMNELVEMSELASILKNLAAEVEFLEKQIEERRAKFNGYEEKMAELSGGVSITVAAVTGETVVRKRKIAAKTVRLLNMTNINELKKELDSLGLPQDRVFQGSSGSVNWHFEPK